MLKGQTLENEKPLTFYNIANKETLILLIN